MANSYSRCITIIKTATTYFITFLVGCSNSFDSHLNKMHQEIITDYNIVMSSRHLSKNKSKQLIFDFFTIDQEYRKLFMNKIISDDLSAHQKTVLKEIEFKKSEAVKRLIQMNKGWFVKSVFGEEIDNMLWILGPGWA